MSTRSERIKLLIEQSGKSYQDLEKITEIKKSSLQRYASGTTTKIPLAVIEQLSNAFCVSQEYLMGWSDSPINKSPTEPQLSEGEKKLLELFRQLPEESQRMYLEVLRATLKNQA